MTIADGLIYTTGNIDGRSVITAMDLDGKVVWQVDNGPVSWTTASIPAPAARPPSTATCSIDESPLGEVGCFDAKTGEKVWSLNILDEFGAKNTTWALAESLLIDGDRVICCPGGPKTAVVALDKQTGETVWKSATPTATWPATPRPPWPSTKGCG